MATRRLLLPGGVPLSTTDSRHCEWLQAALRLQHFMRHCTAWPAAAGQREGFACLARRCGPGPRVDETVDRTDPAGRMETPPDPCKGPRRCAALPLTSLPPCDSGLSGPLTSPSALLPQLVVRAFAVERQFTQRAAHGAWRCKSTTSREWLTRRHPTPCRRGGGALSPPP